MKNTEPISYSAALAELQQLLQELEKPTISLDQLTEYSLRIDFLLQYCKQRLRQTQTDLDKILN